MEVNDKRASRQLFDIKNLKVGSIYEDHDGDILVWTSADHMVVLASPKDVGCLGVAFKPEPDNIYTLINTTLVIKD